MPLLHRWAAEKKILKKPVDMDSQGREGSELCEEEGRKSQTEQRDEEEKEGYKESQRA